MENIVNENMELKELVRSVVDIIPREEGNNDITLKADDGKEWVIKDKWDQAMEMNISEFYQLIFGTIVETQKYVINDDTIPEDIKNRKLIEDPENPLEGATAEQIRNILSNLRPTIQIIREEWEASKRELQITDTHMRQIHQYNQNHKLPMPENLSEEEKKNWDILNGLDNLTDDDVANIFGHDHPLLKTGDHSLMIQRIKDATQDFANWIEILTEYRNLHNAYMELVDLEEEKNVEKLKALAENAKDEKEKARLLSNVETYYSNKYLDFLAEPLDESTRNVLIKAFTDEKKIEYWIKRTRDKMAKLQMSSKFILEIAQFETRFLGAKYAKANNMLLLYFLNIARYMVPEKANDLNTVKTSCMYIMLDKFITNANREEVKERVRNNIIAFEEQILPYIPEKKYEPDAPKENLEI